MAGTLGGRIGILGEIMILRLREWLLENLYLDEDGELYWRASGKRACYASGKYLRVQKNKTWEYAHHIIWLMLTGVWPQEYIDHKDGDGYNNRPYNIREATPKQNIANSDHGKDRGIEVHGNKFRVRFWVNGSRKELGSFSTIEAARAAYRIEAEKQHGEFAFHNRAA